MQRLHATCVSINGRGLLITGPSGSGKSDLALRLIEKGARLVADDQVEIGTEDGGLVARCPLAIAGLIEARHLGLLTVPHLASARLAAALEPGLPEALERLPEPAGLPLLGIALPLARLPYLEASCPAKVRFWLESLP